MRRVAFLLTLLLLVLTVSSAYAQGGGTAPTQTTYVVRAGDTLFTIAQRFDVTVQSIAEANRITNPNVLAVGQSLVIPNKPSTTPPASNAGQGGATTATPIPPAPAPSPIRHVVIDGESLYNIAARYNVTVVSIAQLNNISNFNLIYVGQVLSIPPGGSAVNVGQGGATGGGTTAPPAVITPVPNNQASAVGFASGVQVQMVGAEAASVVEQVEGLGVGWVQQRINWSEMEATRGQIDFTALDAIIEPLDAAGLNILLTVTAAPTWARAGTDPNAAPNADSTYAAFVGALAARYKGVVDAYEIWNEPNIKSEWTGRPLSAQSYVNLLKVAYNAIKLADPAALVVTAGLAPTATNDGVNAIDDRTFLRAMYQAGAAGFSDAIGVHLGGWANPPDSTCCGNNRPAVPAWDDNRAFFFLDTLTDYRQIMTQNNDSGTYLWVTFFGWGSADGVTNLAVPQEVGWIVYNDAQEQAQYLVRAFRKGRDLSYVGPMFVSNLNFCTLEEPTLAQCFYGLLNADGSPRPAYEAIKMMGL